MSNKDNLAEMLRFLTRFPRETVLHALPLLVAELLAAKPEAEIPASVAGVVQTWMEGRGLGADATGQQIADALVATYKEKPIDNELRVGLGELFRSLQTPEGSSFKSFLGDAAGFTPPQPPPKGSVPASPLARFAFGAVPTTKKAP